ncbi:MAG: PAS domain S-box protein [Cyanobacteria bacterium CRU_2_1]|nr:PAS domain S-box protein [Cyanobacteria bacterium RU_5_0]NJR61678.1 PAS domain S-box protein [Cyanobacteria bacterium CRU_2_1]
MSNLNVLSHRIEKIHGRLSKLYRTVNASPSPPVELLPVALMELGIVSEALQLVMKELTQQNEKLVATQDKVESERQRYQTLLELVPDGYLVTDEAFYIQEASWAAANLFNIQQQFLIGKPLHTLVIGEDRSLFQARLSQVNQRSRVELSARFQRYQGDFFNAAVIINVAHNRENGSCCIHWLLRDITEYKRAESALESTDNNPYKDRPTHFYSKGEIILLEPGTIWLVSQGIVKLTTMSDHGEEMLIGLVRESMIFGSGLTALQTYQAIALSKVHLVSISLTEIIQSPLMAQTMLPLISQRLRQTESFLSIYGQLHVEDRLKHLLALLKREIGQSTEEGVRLCARLTHQDFASACCTTRVTITRLLGKLQQQGKVVLDSQNHLILKE